MTMTIAATPEPDSDRIRLRSPADLIATAPFLLGFHPTESLIVVAFQETRLCFAARGDLPGPHDPPGPVVDSLLDVVVRQAADAVVILGYGPPAVVDPLLDGLRVAAERLDLSVRDVLRVHDGRWRSRLCHDPECCPPGGTPVDAGASEVAARLAFAGLTAAPDRSARAREVAPVTGAARAAMDRARDRAGRRLLARLAGVSAADVPAQVLAEGTAAVSAAVRRYADGGRLDDDELAWLVALLEATPVRDVAWASISDVQPHLRMWTDATQRAEPALAAPPACLLAFTAWRSGDGVLASLAVERALLTDPSYPLAHLLSEALRRGEPPAAVADWGTAAWAARLASDPGTAVDQPGGRDQSR